MNEMPLEIGDDQADDETRAGYLYVFHAEGSRFIRIGQAGDVWTRLAQRQVGCPQKLQLLYAVFSTNAPALERLMHDHFAAYHLHGDWFQLPEDVPATLALLAFLYRQSQASLMPVSYDPLARGVLTTEIVELLEKHGTLSNTDFLELLGNDRLTSGALRVQLLRLHRQGIIGKVARGIWRARALTEKAEVTANDVGLRVV